MSSMQSNIAPMSEYSKGGTTLPSPLTCAISAGLLPFVLQYTYTLNCFYYFGAPYFDAGLFANLLWHNDWLLTTAHVYNSDHSYLQVHFSPFLMLVNWLSYIAPTHMVEFYAVFMALIYASLAAAMCYTLMVCALPTNMWQVIALGLLATGFAFNGVVMQGVWMPHFEYAIPAGILMFLVHFKRGNIPWAIFFFALTLSLREDAGLHIAAVLFLLIAVQWLRTRSLPSLKPDMAFALAACAYSAIAFGFGFYLRWIYGTTVSVFQLIYTGTPPYAHLSMQILGERAMTILRDSCYLYTGLFVSLAWAIRRRNVYWIIGFAAYMPWFVVNWTAANSNTGVLYAYYAFPFVLSMGWPCIAILCRYGRKPPYAAVRDALMMQAALVVIGLTVWNDYDRHIEFGPKWWARWGSYVADWWEASPNGEEIDIRPIVRHIAMEVSANQGLGTVMVDSGMMSLTMGSTTQQRGLTILPVYDAHAADTIAYFCPVDGPPPKEVSDKARQSALSAHYRAIDTPLCLFTNRSPEQMGTLARLLERR